MITDNFRVQVFGENLSLPPSVRCIGVVLDENMRWRPHLDSISGRCYAVIASPARLRRTGTDTSLRIQIYRALLEPVLTYGVALRGSSYANVVRSAEVPQNDAIRAITGQSRDASVSHWYSKFRILRVNQLAVLKQATLAFKAVQGSKIWNKLPLSLRRVATVRIFKIGLTELLLQDQLAL